MDLFSETETKTESDSDSKSETEHVVDQMITYNQESDQCTDEKESKMSPRYISSMIFNESGTKYEKARNFAFMCRYGLIEQIIQNIDSIEDINIKFTNGNTFLLCCVQGDHVEAIKILLNHKDIDPYCRTFKGKNLLHLAIFLNSKKTLRWLSERSKYYHELVTRNTYTSCNVFHTAVESKNVEYMIEMLKNENKKIHHLLLEKDADSRTPFLLALHSSQFAMADILLKHSKENIDVDIAYHSMWEGIYGTIYNMKGRGDEGDASYIVMITLTSNRVFELNLGGNVMHLNKHGIILESNYGKEISKKNADKLYDENGLKLKCHHYEDYENIPLSEITLKRNKLIKKYLEAIKDKYIFPQYLLGQIKITDLIANEDNIINDKNALEISEMMIHSNKNQLVINDGAEFIKINKNDYYELIKYETIPENCVVKKLSTESEYHPDQLVILERMNQIPHIHRAIGYTTNNQGIVDNIIYEEMKYNMRDLLNSSDASLLKSEQRIRIINQLFEFNANLTDEHLFDYLSYDIKMSCEDLYLDENLNLRVNCVDFRINVKSESQVGVEKMAICVAEILTGLKHNPENNLIDKIYNNMHDLIVDHQMVDHRIKWTNDQLQYIEYLLVLCVGMYKMSDICYQIPELKYDESTCPICMVHPMTGKYMCSHRSCMGCAKKIKNCYMCRKPVRNPILGYWMF